MTGSFSNPPHNTNPPRGMLDKPMARCSACQLWSYYAAVDGRCLACAMWDARHG